MTAADNDNRRPIVRTVPCRRLAGAFEVQQFEQGGWRAKAVFPSRGDAVAAAKKLIETAILAHMEATDHDGAFPA
ncbi:hypothetical protein ACFSOZ_36790 [Mesorhizobium newzealandense]|uniref:DUF2188 domain-containing protein n=1 Tax=Mesorhizobium newzealandense TaxID=1300302 RepID=A0ABW4ULY4_9HYPH